MKAQELKGETIICYSAGVNGTNDPDGWWGFHTEGHGYMNDDMEIIGEPSQTLHPAAVRKAMNDYGYEIISGGWANGELVSTITKFKISC